MSNTGLLILFVIVLLASIGTYTVGKSVYTAYGERTRTEIPIRKCNLPCSCKHLLGLGTWEWADCLGVGRK